MAHENAYDELGKKYKFMRRRKAELHKPFIVNLYDAFGCEFGQGWYKLLDGLCCDIQNELDKNPELKKTFVVEQVKEKWAGLRFYAYGGNDAIFKLCRKAENKSFKICEQCGNRGYLFCSGKNAGRYMTLCMKCGKEMKYIEPKKQPL